MSDSEGVKVTITGDASGFTDAAGSATTAANNFGQSVGKLAQTFVPETAQRYQQAIVALGATLKDINPVWLETGQGAMRLSEQLAASATQATATTTATAKISTALLDLVNRFVGVEQGFRSAADSAEVFIKALNPTPLQSLRRLMAEDIPAAAVQTGINFQQIINTSTGVGAAFKSAGDSASVFIKALDPTPLQAMRSLMQTELPAAARATTINFQGIINATTGVDLAVKSAADSADVFTREINRISLSDLRRSLSEDIPAAAQKTTLNFQQIIDSSVGVGRAFKSAEESAATFTKALDPTPLQQIRTLMSAELPAAAQQTSTNFQAVINASTGVDRAFKSASDSADVFTRELNRIPVAQLRRSLGSDIPGDVRVMTRSLQENIEAANGMGNTLKSAEESARVFAQALDPSPLQQMKKLMAEDIPEGAGKASGATSGLVREFIVLGHEALVGNWTRIPGTLLVMTEYSEGVRNAIVNMISSFTAMQAVGVGAIGAVAAAFVYMAIKAHEATTAINEATNAATMQGRSPTQARAEMKAYADQMRDTGVMSETAMTQVSSSISQVGALTDAQRQRLASVGSELFLNWDRDAKKTGDEIQKIFASTGSLDSYLKANRLLSDEQTVAWSKATDDATKYDIGLAAITARLLPMRAAIKQAADDAKLNTAMVALGGIPQAGAQSILPPQRLGDFEPGTKQVDPSITADTENTIKLNKHLQERTQLEAELESAKRTLARASTDEQRADATAAITTAQTALQMWRAMGDTSWEAKQQAALLQQVANINANGMTTRQLAMAENEMRLTFWEQQARTAGLTEQQITTAQNNAARARIALTTQGIRELTAEQKTFVQSQQSAELAVVQAAAQGGGTRREIAMRETQARILFWDQQAQQAGLTERQVTAAHIEGQRARIQLEHEEAATTATGAASWLQVQQAALSEQLVGLRAHATSVRGLAEAENRERIKFWADLVAAGGLTQKELLQAQAEGNQAKLALQSEELAGSIAAGKQGLAARLATLSAEQAANHDNFEKVMAIEAQKIAMLRAAGANETKQLQEELAKQENMRREHAAKVLALSEQTLASQRAEDSAAIGQLREQLNEEVTERSISKNQEMQQLRVFAAERHALELAGLNDLLATIDPQLAAYTTLYNKIRVLKQQWLTEDKKMNAEGKADLQRQWDSATAPISSAIDGQVSAMLRGTQTIGQTTANMLGGIITGYAEMGVKAAQHWASSQLLQLFTTQGTEGAKTAATASGSAARGVIGAGETATENAGLLLRVGRWIATQLGLTGATAAGAATREGVLTAEQIASTQATGLAARLSIAAAAAVAAAWAFADSASLGPPGLVAAPGAASGAYASVMAFQLAVPSLDVGAWDVPRNMLANIHAGEMVVPANFASGLRSGGGVGGGGNSSNDVHLNYAPHVSGGAGDMPGLMRAQAGAFKSYLWHATRNGSLKLPGR
jgi:hypothetical protein